MKAIATPAVLLTATLIASGAARADDTALVARGEAIVGQWCGMCHVADAADADEDTGPTFAQVARRPGRDARYLRRFLDEDHFPMPTYRLFPEEKDAVVAYITSLRD